MRTHGCRPEDLKVISVPSVSCAIPLGLNFGRAFSPFKRAISSFKQPICSSWCCTVSDNDSMMPTNASTNGLRSESGISGRLRRLFIRVIASYDTARFASGCRNFLRSYTMCRESVAMSYLFSNDCTGMNNRIFCAENIHD